MSQPTKIKVIDQDGNSSELDLENVGFPIRWEISLAFTQKVIAELEQKNISLDGPSVLSFISHLIVHCP